MPPKKKAKRESERSETDADLPQYDSEVSLSSGRCRGDSTTDNEHETEDDLSDIDCDSTLAECDKRKAELEEDLVELKRQFRILRDQLYEERVNHINEQIDQVAEGSAPDFIEQLQALKTEWVARVQAARVHQEVKTEKVEKEFEAENLAAEQNRDNDKNLTHEELEEDILRKIAKLKEEKRQAEAAWAKKVKAEEAKKKKKKKKKPAAKRGKRRRVAEVSGPHIIYMATPEEIEEDCLAIARARKD